MLVFRKRHSMCSQLVSINASAGQFMLEKEENKAEDGSESHNEFCAIMPVLANQVAK